MTRHLPDSVIIEVGIDAITALKLLPELGRGEGRECWCHSVGIVDGPCEVWWTHARYDEEGGRSAPSPLLLSDELEGYGAAKAMPEQHVGQVECTEYL